MTSALLPSARPTTAGVAGVTDLHFAPEALRAMKTILARAGFHVNPAMLVGKRYSSAFLVDAAVGYQDVLDHGLTPVPMVRDLTYALAWWSGYRYALQQAVDRRQLGWWVHQDGLERADLMPRPEEARVMLTGMAWQVGFGSVQAQAPAMLVLTTVKRGGLLLRAYLLVSATEFQELDVCLREEDLEFG